MESIYMYGVRRLNNKEKFFETKELGHDWFKSEVYA